MSICPKCEEKVNKGTANKKKIRGTIIHKECPTDRLKRIRLKKERDA